MNRISLAACLLGLMAACGGPRSSELPGIYNIDSWSKTSNGCEGEGESVAEDNDPYLEISLSGSDLWPGVPGVEYLEVIPCRDYDQCRGFAASGHIFNSPRSVDRGSDRGGWKGYNRVGDLDDSDERCLGELRYSELERDGDDGVRFTWSLFSYDLERGFGGNCDSDSVGSRVVEQGECLEREVTVASFETALE